MKLKINYLLACATVMCAAASCQKTPETPEPSDETVELSAPSLEASSSLVEITEDVLDKNVLVLNWSDAVPEGKKVDLEYVVYANLASRDMYSQPATFSAASRLEYRFNGNSLGELVKGFGVEAGQEAELQFSVYAKPSDTDIESVVSNIVKVNVKTLNDAVKIPETLYIVGSATSAGWDTSKGIPFTKGSDGLYKIENLEINVVIQDTGFKFYFANDGSSDLFFGPDLSSETFGKAKLFTADDGSANLFQPAMNGYTSGMYTIVFNPEELMMTMTRTGDLEQNVNLGNAVYPQGACFPWGWSFDGPMQKVSEKVYEVKNVKCQWGSDGDSGFKIFIAEGTWSPYFAQGEDASKDNVTVKLITDTDVPQFYPGMLGYEDGIYDIRVDFNTMLLTLTFISSGDDTEDEGFNESTAIFIQGGGFTKYQEWTFDRALALLPSGDGIYVSETPVFLNKWCYFKLVMKDWTEWVRDQSAEDYWTATPRVKTPVDNDCNFIPGNYDSGFIDGEYVVKFDRNTLKLSYEPVKSDIDPATAFYLYGGSFENGAEDWTFNDLNALVPTADGVYKSPKPIHIGEWTYFKFEKQNWEEWVPDKDAQDYWTVTPRTQEPQNNDGTFSIGNVGLKTGDYWVELNLNTRKVTITAAE